MAIQLANVSTMTSLDDEVWTGPTTVHFIIPVDSELVG